MQNTQIIVGKDTIYKTQQILVNDSLVLNYIQLQKSVFVIPLTKLMVFFMGFVLVVTFIANISGIIGFFIFMIMFYYYVKGVIFIEPK